MKRGKRLVSMTAAGICAACGVVPAADLDPVEDALRRAYDVPVRWENVERRPFWFDQEEKAKQPKSRPLFKDHRIHLAPGQVTWTWVPGHASLRLHGKELQAEDLQVELSNGSGLLVAHPFEETRDRNNLFLHPDSGSPILARIRRPESFKQGIEFTVATSRFEPNFELTKYANVIDLDNAEPVRIHTNLEADAQKFWKVEEGQSVDVELEGGELSRFMLETRLCYPPFESEMIQTFRVHVLDRDRNDSEIATLEYVTSGESARLIRVLGEEVVVSRQERGYFALPQERRYRIQLKSSAPLFARLRQRGREFLFPKLNQTDPSPEAIIRSLNGTSIPSDVWKLGGGRLESIVTQFSNEPIDNVWLAANRLARDNSIDRGGLAGATLLRAVSWNRNDYPNIQSAAREFFGHHTYYRDAYPANHEGTPREGLAYFSTRRLQKLGTERDTVAIARQHTDDALKRLSSAEFHQVSNRLHFDLPHSKTPSLVRIAVDRSGLTEPQRLIVSFGDKKIHHLLILPHSELPPIAKRPLLGEGGLRMLTDSHPAAVAGTLDYAFSHQRETAPFINCGHFEFYVSQNVNEVKVQLEAESSPVRVAVQYREGREFRLSERAYRYNASQLGGESEISNLLIRFLSRPSMTPGSLPEQELINQWIPLKRFLLSRYRQVSDSVAEKENYSVSNLEEAETLIAESEFYLAEQMLRYLFLRDRDPRVRDRAFQQLIELAENSEYMLEDQLTLFAAAAIHEPTLGRLTELSQSLVLNGEFDLAFRIALALPLNSKTKELKVRTALIAGWWKTFHELPALPVYDGLAAAHFGDFDEARRFWSEAGNRGKQLIDYLDRSDSIRKGANLNEWARWERDYPETKVWKTIPASETRGGLGAANVQAVETNRVFKVHFATPDKPLILNLASPKELEFEFRPVHNANSVAPMEGWITVAAEEKNSRIPVITNFKSNGLRIIGSPERSLGTKVRTRLSISKWNQTVEIKPHSFAIAVRVKEKRPVHPVGFLPRLGFETAGILRQKSTRPIESAPAGIVLAVGLSNLNHLDLAHRVFDRNLSSLPLENNIPARSRTTNRRDAINLANHLLWEYEQHPDRRDELLARGSQLALKYPASPDVTKVCNRITRFASWEPVLSFEESAGTQEIEFEKWDPESPSFRTRLRLLAPLSRFEQYISGSDAAVSLFHLKDRRMVTLSLSSDRLPFLPRSPEPMLAEYSWDEKEWLPVDLDLESNSWHRRFEAGPGRHSFKVRVKNPVSNQYLRMSLRDDSGDELFERRSERAYVAATPSLPAITRIAGPAWIRIDRFKDGKTTSKVQMVGRGVEEIVLHAEESAETSLFRVHQLRNNKRKLYHSPAFDDREVFPVPDSSFHIPLLLDQVVPGIRDEFWLGRQENGTHTIGLSYHKRREQEEDTFRGIDSEIFFQTDYTYRTYDETKNLYSASRVLMRKREVGADVFGFNQRWNWEPDSHPFSYNLYSYVYQQDGDWSSGLSGNVAQTRNLSPKLSHTPALRFWGRHLSTDQPESDLNAIDKDIFTEFKSDHRYGVGLRDQFTWAPWRDVRLYAGAGFRTNEDFSIDSLDFRAGYRQLIGSFYFDLSYDVSRYLADDNRRAAATRQRVSMEATGDIFKHRSRNRIEAGVGVTPHIEARENTGYVFIRAHTGDGRQRSDFRPAEKPFGNLFKRLKKSQSNNSAHFTPAPVPE